jgi:hypothetical protein
MGMDHGLRFGGRRGFEVEDIVETGPRGLDRESGELPGLDPAGDRRRSGEREDPLRGDGRLDASVRLLRIVDRAEGIRHRRLPAPARNRQLERWQRRWREIEDVVPGRGDPGGCRLGLDPAFERVDLGIAIVEQSVELDALASLGGAAGRETTSSLLATSWAGSWTTARSSASMAAGGSPASSWQRPSKTSAET